MWGIIMLVIIMISDQNAMSFRHGWHRNWRHDFHGHGFSHDDGMSYKRPGYGETNGPHYFPRHTHHWGHGPHDYGSSSHEHFSTENKSPKESGMVNNRPDPHGIHSPKFFPHHPYHWRHGPHNHGSSSHEHFSTENKSSKSGMINSRPSSKENHSPKFFPHHPHHWWHSPHTPDTFDNQKDSSSSDGSSEVRSVPNIGGSASYEMNSSEFLPDHKHHLCHFYYHHRNCHYYEDFDKIHTMTTRSELTMKEFTTEPTIEIITKPTTKFTTESTTESTAESTTTERETESTIDPRGKSTVKPMTTTESTIVTTTDINKVFSNCIRLCPVTSEYNPVCGTNFVTYPNQESLICAQRCGLDIKMLMSSACPRNISQSSSASQLRLTTNTAQTSSTSQSPLTTNTPQTPSTSQSPLTINTPQTSSTNQSPLTTNTPQISTSQSPLTTTTAKANTKTPSETQSQQECIKSCDRSTESRPVCGSNDVTYKNGQHLMCAQFCGVDVTLKSFLPCMDVSTETTITSTTERDRVSDWYLGSNLPISTKYCIKGCPVTLDRKPVCGTDGVTYENPSLVQCLVTCGVNVQMKHEGPCPPGNDTGKVVSITPGSLPSTTAQNKSSQEICIDRCLKDSEYKPVCGSNNVTYRNIEHLRCVKSCQVNVHLVVYHACQESDVLPKTTSSENPGNALTTITTSAPEVTNRPEDQNVTVNNVSDEIPTTTTDEIPTTTEAGGIDLRFGTYP